jgi:hypothetical protein
MYREFLLFVAFSGLALIPFAEPVKGVPVKVTIATAHHTPLSHRHAPVSIPKLADVVDKIKKETEKEHKEFQLHNDIGKMKLTVDDLFRRYIEAKRLYELSSVKYNKSHTDWEAENKTFEHQKNLLSHIYEFVKVYQSTTNKDKFYRTHCLCNSSVV